jgi:hypothetical protein
MCIEPRWCEVPVMYVVEDNLVSVQLTAYDAKWLNVS